MSVTRVYTIVASVVFLQQSNVAKQRMPDGLNDILSDYFIKISKL
jgi:hypothetical protein